MATVNFQTHSGNRIEIRLDGRVVGLIQSLRASDNFGLEDASGIGDPRVVEHVPSKAVHTLSVSTMAFVRANLRTELGEVNENAEAAMRALVFDVRIFSKPWGGTGSGALLREYLQCSWDSGDLDITAHRIVMQSGQLKAIDVRGVTI